MAFGPIRSLGRVTTNAGTPVRLTNNESDPTERYQCHAVMVEQWHGNGGKVWVFDKPTASKVTGEGVVAILAAPATNILPTFTVGFSGHANPIDASLYWIDVDSNGEGPIVSVIVL